MSGHEGSGKRKRKSEEYEPLCQRFSKSLNRLMSEVPVEGELLSLNKLAKKIGSNPTAVQNWAKGTALPRVDELYLVAKTYDISIDAMLGGSNILPIWKERKDVTYADAFSAVAICRNIGLISDAPYDSDDTDYKEESISYERDPFLKYLLSEHKRINGQKNIDRRKKAAWYGHIMRDYNITLLSIDTLQFFGKFMERNAEIDKYKSYLSCLHGLKQLEHDLAVCEVNKYTFEEKCQFEEWFFDKWAEEYVLKMKNSGTGQGKYAYLDGGKGAPQYVAEYFREHPVEPFSDGI